MTSSFLVSVICNAFIVFNYDEFDLLFRSVSSYTSGFDGKDTDKFLKHIQNAQKNRCHRSILLYFMHDAEIPVRDNV